MKEIRFSSLLPEFAGRLEGKPDGADECVYRKLRLCRKLRFCVFGSVGTVAEPDAVTMKYTRMRVLSLFNP